MIYLEMYEDLRKMYQISIDIIDSIIDAKEGEMNESEMRFNLMLKDMQRVIDDHSEVFCKTIFRGDLQ